MCPTGSSHAVRATASPPAARVAPAGLVGPDGLPATPDRIASETRLGHWQLDLQKSCLLQLEAAGIPRRQIELVAECTCCHKETFFSYRRDQGRTGRQMGFMLLPR